MINSSLLFLNLVSNVYTEPQYVLSHCISFCSWNKTLLKNCRSKCSCNSKWNKNCSAIKQNFLPNCLNSGLKKGHQLRRCCERRIYSFLNPLRWNSTTSHLKHIKGCRHLCDRIGAPNNINFITASQSKQGIRSMLEVLS